MCVCSYLLKHDIFGPLMAVFARHCVRYNLVNSAVIELIEFIRSANIKSLVEHVVAKWVCLPRPMLHGANRLPPPDSTVAVAAAPSPRADTGTCFDT